MCVFYNIEGCCSTTYAKTKLPAYIPSLKVVETKTSNCERKLKAYHGVIEVAKDYY